MAEYTIKVSDLDESPKALRFPIRREWLAAELQGTDFSPGPESGEVSISAHLSGDDVIVTGTAQSGLVVPCARCLEDVSLALEVNLGLLFSPTGPQTRPTAEEAELTPEEIAQEFFEGDEIVLDSIVREGLILEVPMQPHCTRPECLRRWEGGVKEATREAALDPRLSPLLALKEQLAKK
ncbi:MAG: DUF177 domain-containing protein [Myxococcota bacterium]